MKQIFEYFPLVLYNIRKKGFEEEITTVALRAEFMEVTGVLNRNKTREWIDCLEEMGYLKKKNDSIIKLTRKCNKLVDDFIREKKEEAKSRKDEKDGK